MHDEPVNEDLVTIKTVTTLGEAEIAAAVLEDNGIRAFVPNANASAVMPHLFTAINTWGVKVQVMARDAEAAAEKIEKIYENMRWIDASVNEKLNFEELLLNLAS